MSMTLKETLVSCERLFNYTKTEIDLLRKKIIKLIETCKSFSSNKSLIDEINKMLSDVDNEYSKISNFINTNPTCEEIELEIERYNKLNNMSDRVKNKLIEFNTKISHIEKIIIDSEKKDLLNILNSNDNSLEQIKKEIMNSYNDLDDKMIVKGIFEKEEHIIVNMNPSSTFLFIDEKLNNFKLNNEFVEEQFMRIFDAKNNNEIFIAKTICEKAKTQNLNTYSALQYANDLKENYEYQSNNADRIIQAITNIGYNVNNEDIIRNPESNSILVRATNFDGKEVDFSIRLDGSLVYNFEGFENHDHDIDFNIFKLELKKSGLVGKLTENKVYREPSYVKKNKSKDILYKKK